MVINLDIRSYVGWLMNGTDGVGALVMFGVTFGAVAFLALLGGFIVQLVRYGPAKAGDLTYRGLAGGVADLFRASPRRIAALSYLAVKEAIRRRAPVALAVFALILVFAGWFLQTNYQDPAKLQMSFVLYWTTILVLIMALLLSTFSLPNDFKTRTIYTIMTKPVRSVDIVLGRIVGFGLVGTVMLVIMSGAGYLFVNRTLDHAHTVEMDSLQNLTGSEGEVVGKEGRTGEDRHFHRHTVQIDQEGNGVAATTHGHSHTIGKDANGTLVTGGAQDTLRARVPKLGTLSFRARNGQRTNKGVSTGSEWTYRSSIEGGTLASAVWLFEGISAADLRGEGENRVLPVELIVRVFRTHKGNLERGIQGTIRLQNPETGLKSDVTVFPAKDQQINVFSFPIEQYDEKQNPINLLDDLISSKGELEIAVQALDRAQYFSFAQADCYIRKPDGSPLVNYIKGCLSIWVQMLIVITLGVTASTFLNGPIATLFTSSMIVLGFFREFFVKVAKGEEWGGGPIESAVRMVTHMNVMSPFPESPSTTLMKAIDAGFQFMMQGIALLLPDFPSLSTSDYVARGFSIPEPLVGRGLTIALAYLLGMTIASLFILRTREVAKD